jgi:hypothetical protein
MSEQNGSDRVGDDRVVAGQVLRSIWGVTGQSAADLDDDCGPTKACKNMQHVSFDGMAEPGTDLTEAWRDRLRREGKLSSGGGSIRDLVLGQAGSGSGEDR